MAKNLGVFLFTVLVALFVVAAVLIGLTWAINDILFIFGPFKFQVFDTATLLAIIYFIRRFTTPVTK